MKLNNTGLDYINLQTGKYFIYRDSASGISDSVMVIKSSLVYVQVPEYRGAGIFDYSPAYSYQSFTLVLSKLSPDPAGEWFHVKTISLSHPFMTDSAEIVLQENDNSGTFGYPAVYSNVELIPSLIIEGKTYTDIIQYTDENGLNIDDPLYKKRIYCWAKTVGIIKRTTISSGGIAKVYTLLRNN